MKWISIKEKEPEFGRIVLVKGKGLQTTNNWHCDMCIAKRIEYHFHKTGYLWGNVSTGTCIEHDCIEYWFPLDSIES